MPKIVILSLVLLLSSCAKPWPAAVASFDGLSPSEREAVEAAIGSLNERAGREVVRATPDEKQFPISFKVEALRGEKGEQVGGEAEVGPTSCTIALSPKVLRGVMLETVVWHELGHCGGLDHVAGDGEVMSAEAHAFRNYPAARLERFVQTLRQSTGLNR